MAVRWGVSTRINDEPAESSGLAGAGLATASVGKVLLLLATARGIAAGELRADERLRADSVCRVADSGLWQHLSQPDLAVADLAALVGSVSDNLATNVLLGRVGMDAVEAVRVALGLEATRLLDIVRDERGPDDPQGVSVGSADELRGLFEWLRSPDGELSALAAPVVDWLRPGCDLSMVASAFCLDPLAHVEPDRGFTVVNKTGTNSGVRADVGFVEGPGGRAAYAAIANWEAGDCRDDVMREMRRLGKSLRTALEARPEPG